MSVRRPSHRSVRSRGSRSARLFAEALENRVVLSTSLDPAVGVTSVLMHTNYEEFHAPGTYPSWLTPSPLGILPQDNGLTGPSFYTPAEIRAAYGVNAISFGTTAGDGTGQTIAIVDAYDDPSFVDSTAPNFSTSDLAEFDKAFGLPNPPSFTKYNQNGSTTNLPGTDPAGAGNPNGNWEVEEALDVEWAHAIAPGASIDLIECNSSALSDLYTGVVTAAGLSGVSAVSMSFGSSEFSGEQTLDNVFTTPAGHTGVTFLAATGDHGSPGFYPAYSPNVVAVGGTTLFINPDNSYNNETGWTGSGGGISQYESPPGYQAEIQTVQPLSGRAVPDVSNLADPDTGVSLYDSYNNGTSAPWTGVGGTSLATPMWAGLIAITNQGRVSEGGTTLNSSSNSTQTLNAIYSLPTTDFHSITTGNNGGFSAKPGYSEVTGLGSPIANLLVPDLAAYGTATQLVVTAQPPPTVGVDQPFDLQVSAEDSYGHVDHSYGSAMTLSDVDLNGSPVTASASNGVATFNGVSVNAGGDSLLVTSGTLSSATTNVINTNGTTPVGYTPQQIQTAYGVNDITFGGNAGNGQGQTIALIDFYDDPNILSDLTAFDQAFGLPNPTFNKYTQNGWTPVPDPTGGWEGEEALDVEWANPMAPGATIDLFELNPSDSDLQTAQLVQVAAGFPGVSVVSMSFGSTGDIMGEAAYDQYYTTPSGHQGVTFVASAGDHGTPGGYPAFSPNVVAVGGTSLFLNSDGSYDGEIVWSDGSINGTYWGTGGGVSTGETEPGFQEGVQTTTSRTIPDVAFEADLYTGVALYNSYGTSSPWTIVGGTSLSSPAWAGLIAIANQGRVSEGGTTLNSGNTGTNPQQTQTALYSLPYTDYHDVTSGNNGTFSAGPGYDAVTGLGSPIANLLVPDLAAYGMATQLAVTDQPPSNVGVTTSADYDLINVVITAEDANGHVDSSYNGSITLTNLPSGAYILGSPTVTAIHGVARFTDIYFTSPGTGDTIQATASGLTTATSNPFNVGTVLPGGTWQNLDATGTGPTGIIALMLLSDGTVMAQGPGSGPAYDPTTSWYRLTPDSTGNYATGNWTQLGSMNEGRRFSTTVMLPNGDVFIVGGEYSTPDPFTNTAEIFDPTANAGAGSWSFVDSVPTTPTNVDLSGAVTGASNASPIVITSQSTSQLQNGQTVVISNVAGNTNANGTWTIAGLTSKTFQLVGSSGNGNYTGGGEWNSYVSQFGDDPIEVLPVGSNGQSKILAGWFGGPTTYIFNPANPSGSQWTTTATSPNKLYNDRSDEESWVKLADGSILSYDVFSSMNGTFQAQRYIPSQNQWVDASTLSSVNPPSILSDPSTASNGGEGAELGPGFLLPNGSVMIFGANGNTAIFTPSSNGGSWSAGPQEPQLPLTVSSNGSVTDGGSPTFLVATDDPGAMLPDGNILIALSPLGSSLATGNYNFPDRTYIYEYDPVAQTFTPANINGSFIPENAFALNMVELPSGQVLLGDESGTAEIYTPSGTPNDAWRPVVTNIANNGNNTYTLTGTQLNGISEGADYGDDLSSASNYPIVQLVNSTGQVYYARTYDWSSTGVATGSTSVTTLFTLPAGLQSGTYSLYVVANGIASASVTFNVGATVSTTTALGSSLNPSTYGQSVKFTATVSDTSGGVPTGSVEFYDGSTDLGPGSTLSGSGNSGTSTFTTSTLTAGSQSIKAVYTPTGNFAGSSGSLTQKVNTAALTITADSTSKTYGNTLTFAGTAFTDSGLVNGNTVSSVTLTSSGAAATATVISPGPTYSIIPSAAVGTGLSNYTITYVNGTLTVTPKTLTASITAANKVYDGTTTATATNQPLSGVVNGDSVSLTGGTATFANKNVGTGKTVTDTGLSLTGTGAGNYQLASTTATTTANITPRALTITAVANTKTYDATTAAAATPKITAGSLQGSDTANFKETYASKNVGTNLVLTPSGTVNDGNSGNNYTYTFNTVSNRAITPAALTLTAVTNTKVYDGTTTAAAIPTVSGLKGSDSVTKLTESYASPNVGTGITLNVATYTINDGNNGGNYAVTLVANNTGVITAPPATATFNGQDSTTEGSWSGVYGSQGYNVINATNGVAYPSYATVTTAGNAAFTWTAKTTALPALEVPPSGTSRIAAAWYASSSFTVDVDLTDSKAHDLELYFLDYDTTSRSEQVVLTDANSHAVLSTQTVSSFHDGVYMSWTISGNVLITITKQAGTNAVLSGLFFDPTPVSTNTSVGSSLNPSTTGQSVTFTATVSDTSGVPTGSVEFYDGSTDLGPGSALSGSGNSATSTFATSTLTAGSHSIHAVYTPTGNFAGSSGNLTQTVNIPPATATFNGKDTNTEGSWIGVYGSQGYNVINATNGVAYPAYATVTTAGNAAFTWTAKTTALPALEVPPTGTSRIAAAWYASSSFTVDVDLTDGQTHNIELYFLDYDTTSRSEQVVLTDANTHAVLSTQTVSSFHTGIYMNYTISGNVLITITKQAGSNAVLSGLFFDPTPVSTTTSVGSSLNPSTTGQSVTFTATVSDTSGVPTGSVEFYDGSTDLGPGSALSGSGNSATSTFATSTLTAGSHSIRAVYTPTGNFAGSFGSLTQTVNIPPATATFNGKDTNTEGSWIGVYGGQGYNVINATNGVAYPAYATVTTAGNAAFTWTAKTTALPALEVPPAGTSRIAAAWYASSSFTVGVDLTDSKAHDLELYFLDYDTTSRSEQVVLTDANTHTVLSTQTVSSFHTGIYMNYTISGNVLITITKQAGTNAVLSGLFFDPTPVSTTTSVGSSLNPSTTGQSVTFTATVSDTSGVPTGTVEFYDGSTDLGPGSALSGSGNSATSTFATSTLTVGSHSIRAVYTPTGNFAGSFGSLTQTVNIPPATATFNGKDTNTEGSWIGVYGSQGYNVINATNGVAYPAYATVTTAGNAAFTWTAKTTALPALEVPPTGTSRIAAAWYASSSFTVDVDLTDGLSHNIELYFLDYDTTSRSEQVVLTDANTHAVLSTQTVSSFHTGIYMNYTISGNVLITITKQAGSNAVLSGLFFDPTPVSTTTSVGSSLNPSTTGQSVTFTATVSDTSGVPTGTVEFYDGSTDLGPGSALSGSGNSATSTFATSTLTVGSHSIRAVYTPTGNFAGSFGSLTQTVNIPPATATFNGKDTNTEGSWIGVYGGQGYNVINATNGVAYPAYATVTTAGNAAFTWTAKTTALPALEVPPTGTSRIAAAWYASSSFTVDVDLTDGQAHNIELYFLDYDTTSRSEQVVLSDANTHTVLSTQTVSSFHTGLYMSWTISGNVLITITKTGGTNAVLSGLFFDPTTTGPAVVRAGTGIGGLVDATAVSSRLATDQIGTLDPPSARRSSWSTTALVSAHDAALLGSESSASSNLVTDPLGTVDPSGDGPEAPSLVAEPLNPNGKLVHDLALEQVWEYAWGRRMSRRLGTGGR